MADNQRELREILVSSFTRDELFTLATDIAGNAELVFPQGGTLETWARELVAWCRRQGKTESLINCLQEARPEAYEAYRKRVALGTVTQQEEAKSLPKMPVESPAAKNERTSSKKKATPIAKDTGKLSVFLCHSSQDKLVVRWFYQQLSQERWIDPWLDEEKLLPGMDWKLAIETAVEAAGAVLVFISRNSVTKEGYVQRELTYILDMALEKPEGTIFVIPVRLDDCELPRRLRSLHYVDCFPAEQQERAIQRIIKSLEMRRLNI